MSERNSITQLFIETCHRLADLDLEIGPSGNMSVRTSNDKVYITPSGSEFRDISPNNISTIKNLSDSEYIGSKPSSDLELHLAIYGTRSDIKVILHTHAHPVVVAAMIGAPIPVLNTMHADYFGKQVQAIPYFNHRQTETEFVEYFKQGDAFLLGKHGGLLLFSELDIKKHRKHNECLQRNMFFILQISVDPS